MNNYVYEKEIDIVDMLKVCLQKWRIILVVALLGGIFGVGISIYSISNQKDDKEVILEDISEKSISLCEAYIEVKEKLDSVNISEIDTNEELN